MDEPAGVAVTAQEEPDAEPDDEDQAAHLDEGRRHVGPGGLADAAGVQQGEEDQEDGRHRDDGEADEGGQVVAGEASGQRGHGHDARGEHAEAGEEAGEGPVGEGRVVGGAAGPGVLRAELGVRRGREQREQQREEEGHPHGATRLRGDLADEDVDAGAQHVSEDEEVQQGGGEGLLERGGAVRRRGAVPGGTGGRRCGWSSHPCRLPLERGDRRDGRDVRRDGPAPARPGVRRTAAPRARRSATALPPLPAGP